MNESAKFEMYKKKLQGVCDENDLIFTLRKNKYPMRMTIRPVGGMDGQISMLENAEEAAHISPDAFIQFEMKDGEIDIKTSKEFAIGESTFSKIKNLFKKMHAMWVQFFFRDLTENGALPSRMMPHIEEEEDLLEDAEPIESFESDDEDADDEGSLDDLVPDEEVFGEMVREATVLVRDEGTASLDLLQRRMHIGKALAKFVMRALEEKGVIGAGSDDSPREVLI